MTKTSLRYRCGGVVLMVPLLLLMAGCGPSQQELMAQDKFEKARALYNEASANPTVSANAPVALLDAAKQLKAADSASGYVEKEHLAYLAERKTQTAVAIAEKKAAEIELEKLSKESSSILLAKRERELMAAQSLSEAKGRELEKLRIEAEQRSRELEKARQEAGTMAGESEQARQLAAAKVREAEEAKLLAEARQREAEEARKLAEAKTMEAEKSRAESEQLVKELSELKAKQTERGIVLTVGDVLFETGKANLSPRAEISVAKLAEFLKKNPKRNLLIEGHTDSVGSAAYNITLSQRRADSVKRDLLTRGIAPERITTKGYGEQYPVATNDTKLGRQHNRRVEVIILNEGVAAESVVR